MKNAWPLTAMALVIGALSLIAADGPPPKSKCTGSSRCQACENCKSCKHCSKDGGSCSVSRDMELRKQQEQEHRKRHRRHRRDRRRR